MILGQMNNINLKVFLLSIFFFSVLISAQEKAQTNQWRGLVLDDATPEKAIEVLGKPKSDKQGQKFRPIKFNEWFDVKGKTFRILHYENAQTVKGFDDVKLVFRDDKLVVIWLEPEKLEASLLALSYEGEFIYLSDKMAESFFPSDFERNQGKTYPKSYPELYYLMNKTEYSYAFAMIANNSFGAIFGKALGVKDASESLPGKISVIQLISTSLQTSKGTNLLK